MQIYWEVNIMHIDFLMGQAYSTLIDQWGKQLMTFIFIYDLHVKMEVSCALVKGHWTDISYI